jgi:hypothetical protein
MRTPARRLIPGGFHFEGRAMAVIEETKNYRIIYGPEDRVWRIFMKFRDKVQSSRDTWPDLKSATDAYKAGKVAWNEPEGEDAGR